jgi:hypothetical protein
MSLSSTIGPPVEKSDRAGEIGAKKDAGSSWRRYFGAVVFVTVLGGFLSAFPPTEAGAVGGGYVSRCMQARFNRKLLSNRL